MNEQNGRTAGKSLPDISEVHFGLSNEQIPLQIVPHSDFTQLNSACRKVLTVQGLTRTLLGCWRESRLKEEGQTCSAHDAKLNLNVSSEVPFYASKPAACVFMYFLVRNTKGQNSAS